MKPCATCCCWDPQKTCCCCCWGIKKPWGWKKLCCCCGWKNCYCPCPNCCCCCKMMACTTVWMAGERSCTGICASCRQHCCRSTRQLFCCKNCDRRNDTIGTGMHCCTSNCRHGFNCCCRNGCRNDSCCTYGCCWPCKNGCCGWNCQVGSNCTLAVAMVTTMARKARMRKVFIVDLCWLLLTCLWCLHSRYAKDGWWRRIYLVHVYS